MKKRIYISYVLLLVTLIGVLARIGQITTNETLIAVGASQSKRAMTVATVRGTIYDRNRSPLVNAENRYVAALIPTKEMLSRIRTAMDEDAYRTLIDGIRTYQPVSATLNSPVSVHRDLMLFQIPTRYTEKSLSPHLIGYLNGAGEGVCGIEKEYNQLLTDYSGSVRIRYDVNGLNHVQTAEPFTHTDTTASAAGGVILTLDSRIQEIVELVGQEHIQKGAIVIIDPKSGDVLASSSFPTFSQNDVATAMEQEDSPLFNRVLGQYDCGSVFKTVTAIAALDDGISINQCYDCTGEMWVGETLFHCHNRTGHRLLNLEQAYASSCNLYFIQLAQEIGAERLLNTADKLGLTQSISLTDTIVAKAPTLPSLEDLSSPAALANLSFGQGELLISPLHITRITAAIAGSGTMPTLDLVIGTMDADDRITATENRGGETVLSATHTDTLKKMMESVVSGGTGQSAQTSFYSSAGKTGTAETGQLDENGNSVTQSWFTGYYPADAPKYCITILIEDAQKSTCTAAEIFSMIANQL